MINDTRDITFTFNGKNFVIPSVTGDFCSACGKGLLNGEQSTRYINLFSAFRSSLD